MKKIVAHTIKMRAFISFKSVAYAEELMFEVFKASRVLVIIMLLFLYFNNLRISFSRNLTYFMVCVSFNNSKF